MQPVALHHRHLGDPGAPPLLIAHGLLGSSSNWNSIARKLAVDHCVWLLDMRNHGRSPHAEDMGYPAMAADMAQFIDAHALYDSTVIGHSMGGKAAMWLALEQPSKVRQLVVVDIAPRPSPGDHRGVIDAMCQLDLARVASRADADAALAPAIPDTAMRTWLLQNLSVSGTDAHWRVNVDAIARSHDLLIDFPSTADLSAYQGPTLFVRGETSNYLLESDQHTLRHLFPKARMANIAAAGHWLHAEQPAAFLAVLQAFLARHGGKRA